MNKQIVADILEWYAVHSRPLPWRETTDPYLIWVSEIILQQTRVEQGMDYYRRFIDRFPDVLSLASADEDELMRYWEGLGYYSRARNLHAAAKEIVKARGGVFPADHAAIRSLKGVGDYTAAAIASFAFGLPYAAVDGNVYRWLSRVFGISTPIDSGTGRKAFAAIADTLLDRNDSGRWNQAAMEFGTLQCVPRSPDCPSCPIRRDCVAFRNGTVGALPVKQSKTVQKERWFHYLVIRRDDELLIGKRTGNDIWRNLYEFPLIETESETAPDRLFRSDRFVRLFGADREYTVTAIRKMPKHLLSHRVIRSVFYEISVREFSESMIENYQIVPLRDLGDYAFPRLIGLYSEHT